jgi:ABC-type Fe3+ transport system substrate-binding protein
MKNSRKVWSALTVLANLSLVNSLAAAELPKATQALLRHLNKDPSVLAGLDQELAVPPAWIEGARKEGTFKLVSTWKSNEIRRLLDPFEERYPFIKVEYRLGANRENRIVSTLVAFHNGQYISDVIEGVSGGFNEFQDADALADLRDMPGWNNIADGLKTPDGTSIGFRQRFWCAAYNTDLVAKSDLPATWEGFVTNPRWFGNKIGVGNRPNLWLLNLWGLQGEAWARDYATKLFNVTKPQLRKEGLDALVGLVVAGEFQLSFPSSSDTVLVYQKRGAPVSWYCPEPVPAAVTGILVLKGNPHINASKLFVNWLVSKEGQLAAYATDSIPPAHKDLQNKEFLPFADEVIGKKVAFQDLTLIEKVLPDVEKFWNPLWSADRRH